MHGENSTIPMDDTVQSLSLLEEAAIEHSPVLRVLRKTLEKAIVEKKGVVEWRDPELRMHYGQNRQYDAITDYKDTEDVEVALRAYVPNFLESRAGHVAADAQINIITSRIAYEEWQARVEVRVLLASIRYNEEVLKLADQKVSIIDDQRKIMDELQQMNESRAYQSVEINTKYLDAISKRDEVEADLNLVRQELSSLTGQTELPVMADIFSDAWINKQMKCVNGDIMHDHILDADDHLNSLMWRVEKASADVQRAQRRRMPWISHLQVSYQEDLGSSDDQDWRVQAAMNIPVFSLFAHPEEDVLSAVVDQSQEEYQTARELLSQEIERTVQVVQGAYERWQRYESLSAPLLDDMQKEVDKAKTRTAKLSLQSDMIEINQSRQNHKYMCIKALLDLQSLVGDRS